MRKIAIWGVLVSCGVSLPGQEMTAARVGEIRGELEGWLRGSDLGTRVEAAKLRWSARPGVAGEEAAPWLQWELLFRTQGTKTDEENRRFVAWLHSSDAATERTPVERIFYRLLHEAELRRTDIAVAVGVLEETYWITFDPQNREISIRREDVRDFLRRDVDLSNLGAGAARRKGSIALETTIEALEASVQAFLEGYFAGPAPVRVNPAKPEKWAAGVTVEHLRKRVVANQNFWEKLHISIDLKGTPQAPWAVCNISGKWAAGMGSRLPTDYKPMDPRYNEDLSTFTDRMLAALKKQLSERR